MRVLVTGSSGMIGTRLCESLMAADGMECVGVDRRANGWRQEQNQLTLLGDLCEPEFVRTLPRHIDVVVHLAANARVYNLVVEPDLAFENFRSTYNVLEYCRANGIRRIIFASSREVYGNTSGADRSEDDVCIHDCESAYTASKMGGEALMCAYHRCYGIGYVISRFSNVYGMYDSTDRVIPLFIRQAAEDMDLVVYGKDKLLDFTYIDDTVAGIMLCIGQFESVQNSVLNIATGTGVSITDVANMIIDMTGSHSRVVLDDNRTGEVVRFTADISNAKRRLGYEPRTSISAGLQKTIAWYARYMPRSPVSRAPSILYKEEQVCRARSHSTRVAGTPLG